MIGFRWQQCFRDDVCVENRYLWSSPTPGIESDDSARERWTTASAGHDEYELLARLNRVDAARGLDARGGALKDLPLFGPVGDLCSDCAFMHPSLTCG